MQRIYRSSDLFASSAQVLVNPVNSIGVMGKGLALAFAQRYPEIVPIYQKRCADGTIRPGRVHLIRRASGPWILNFPTKNHWRDPSRLQWIEEGLDDLIKKILAAASTPYAIHSIAIPPLGCGNGGLRWSDVLARIEHATDRLQHLDITIEIYGQSGAIEQEIADLEQRIFEARLDQQMASEALELEEIGRRGGHPVLPIAEDPADPAWLTRLAHLKSLLVKHHQS